MIHYPVLNKQHIGITAPSSGMDKPLHPLMHQAVDRLHKLGFTTTVGKTVWTQQKAKSADKHTRAKELNAMLQDASIDLIFPPWGGQLLIEILELIEFDKITPKWLLGYSDTSALLLAITLKTGMATAHGTNAIDIRGKYSDDTTKRWSDVLETKAGETVTQRSSEFYQVEWQHDNPTDYIFHLTEKTEWKTVRKEDAEMEGRLLGGCTDIIHHLAGTPYGDVTGFSREPIIWYFENCEGSPADLKRAMTQMKYAGWFDNCSGILFGRTPVSEDTEGYTFLDVYSELREDLDVPVFYDIDCGHVPPQITFVNGAHARVTLKDGQAEVVQTFLS